MTLPSLLHDGVIQEYLAVVARVVQEARYSRLEGPQAPHQEGPHAQNGLNHLPAEQVVRVPLGQSHSATIQLPRLRALGLHRSTYSGPTGI